jgi:hypothetical protein
MMVAQDFASWNLQQLNKLALASGADVDALAHIEAELKYRREPQALALLVEVRDMLSQSQDAGRALGGSPSL